MVLHKHAVLLTLLLTIQWKGEMEMPNVEEILSSIESLSREDFARLREWFYERDWEGWDKEIESDSQSGTLDFLLKDALFEKENGKLKEL